MKKKVGIITIYDVGNYGNRLQNYAAQKLLTDMGYETKSYHTHIYGFSYRPQYRFKKTIHELTGYRLTKSREEWARQNKNYSFELFTKKYLPTERVDCLDNLGEKADYFVIGSDQVWNPSWYRRNVQDLYLLTFAKPEQKVCLSPSIGLSELPDEWRQFFESNLRTFPALNIREKSGADIIKKLTGQDAQVTIDPTMMLDAKDWLQIAKKPYGVSTRKPFLLTCFLGDRTEKAEKDIADILMQRELKVYHLMDQTQPFVYACGPREFLYMLSKADIVLTDSFHVCIFSFLFNKPFAVYDREQAGCCQMNGRIESLLHMLHIERKYRDRNGIFNWFECDYRDGYNVLGEERKRLKEYLYAAFCRN